MYYTVQGDTFDLIAFKLWGDSRYTEQLINANRHLITTFIFEANVELKVPVVEKKGKVNLPPWK